MNNFARLAIGRLNLAIAIISFIGFLILNPATAQAESVALPSTDKSTIAMIARWNSREDFESLSKNLGFDKETNYWQTYADNEHDLFDVVKIIR